MLVKVFSGTTVGLDGVLIEVEVDVAERGFPTFTIVGLPDRSVDEAKHRVRSAIIHAGFEMPDSRITVNLAPANIPKVGSVFDLPIAIGIMAASGVIKLDKLKDCFFIGELSLDGKVRRVTGAISLADLAKKTQKQSLFLPTASAYEASLIHDLEIFPVLYLSDLILHLNEIKKIQRYEPGERSFQARQIEIDFADIRGQKHAKRSMIIAAAGFHNIHLKGPPGAGKTLLGRAFASILPSMTKEEIIEVSRIYSITGLLPHSEIIRQRPFRSPHHTISRNGLIGGGSTPCPGEVTLAHQGVLFLDEFPEFPRSVLEALRQPLEDGHVLISRVTNSVMFPCRFLLLAASNPCPCGYLGHPKKRCSCMPGSISSYRKRLSGPLLDRIDMHVNVSPVEDAFLLNPEDRSFGTAEARAFVERAVKRQKRRFRGSKVKTNGEMMPSDIKRHCILSQQATDLLCRALSKLSLSARSYYKLIKISQTIADLERGEIIEEAHLAEALQYRPID